ncbi:MAG TPA: cbb3-type cytochrome oxidase assembly protein CcoS [Verrucomicrobiae bacterium]
MSVVIVLILASLLVGLIFLAAFIWAVRGGQYEDTVTPSMRVLLDDAAPMNALTKTGDVTAPYPAAVNQNRAGQPEK